MADKGLPLSDFAFSRLSEFTRWCLPLQRPHRCRSCRLWLPTPGRFSLIALVQENLKRVFARPPLWLFVLVGAAALALLLSIVVRVYSPAYGLTRLIVIGSEFNRRGIAVYQATPKYIDPIRRTAGVSTASSMHRSPSIRSCAIPR